MLITAGSIRCSRCKKQLTSRADRSRLYVETDRSGNLKAVCSQCHREE